MFLCQPLIEVLAGRGIEDIDAFLKVPSWNDLPDPFLIPSMEKATARVLCAVRQGERITIHGDYDCDGVLGTHILRGVLTGLGASPIAYLPHRDEGYGLSSATVHRFSCSGTDLLITVDNGINGGWPCDWHSGWESTSSRSITTVSMSRRKLRLYGPMRFAELAWLRCLRGHSR
jgi:single-stranded-DNA-specific exonuclease